MSIWGKIVGGVGGFALGGPLGALIGALGGHLWDAKQRKDSQSLPHDPQVFNNPWGSPSSPSPSAQSRGFSGFSQQGGHGGESNRDDNDPAVRYASVFGVAIIALAAKLSKADGRVSVEEIRKFKSIFNVPPAQESLVGEIFKRARESSDGYEIYAQQIADVFHDNPPVLETMLYALVSIAAADGQIHAAEYAILADITRIFGFSPRLLDAILHAETQSFARAHAQGHAGAQSHGGSHAGYTGQTARGTTTPDPYAVLGLSRNLDNETLKKEYRRLVREHHPDYLVSKGVPQEMITVATKRLSQINAAYDVITKQRGL